jgi:uncharacterized protein (TIGR00730 family)
MNLRTVTVYCSSSRQVAPAYFDAAKELGIGIAREGWSLVYGGNNVGLMDAVASSCRLGGGKVIGITPKLMMDEGIADPLCSEMVVTQTMRERKALLEARGDALVALPGGIGTFEELFEVLVGRMLGYHDKPIVIVNVERYYDPLIAMMEHGIEQKFIRPKAREAYFIAETVEAALEYLRTHSPRAPTQDPHKAEPSAKE